MKPRIPETRYEYCLAFAQLLKKPVGYILGRTKGVEERHLAHAYSEVRYERDFEKKKKILMYWLKNLEPK